MADIVIRGVDIPKGDLEYVSLWVYGDGRVYVSNKDSAKSSQRLQDLAVSLSAGHGKIIDADKLWENMTVEQSEAFQKGLAGIIELFEILEAADAIIPSEDKEG